MGRPLKSVAVVKAYDAEGNFVCEDIVPSAEFAASGSMLFNDASVRAERGIRFISFRHFDGSGAKTHDQRLNFDLAGKEVRALYHRPDGTIIEDPPWV
jgi:hypothetical protein